jgi:hypothetical protein
VGWLGAFFGGGVVVEAAALPLTTNSKAQGKKTRTVTLRSIASANLFTLLPAAVLPNKTLSGKIGCGQRFFLQEKPAGTQSNTTYRYSSGPPVKMTETEAF